MLLYDIAKEFEPLIDLLPSRIRSDYFKGLDHLYSVNLGGNRIDTSEPLAFANLPRMNHLDIRYFFPLHLPNF